MSDPLAGKRNAIANRAVKVLTWPAREEIADDRHRDVPCPVSKGDRFPLRGGLVIEIETVNRKLVKGKPAEWHATFIRHEIDRPQLLRFVPPTRSPKAADNHLGLSEQERARREGAYTTSPHAASPGEPESVGPDWEDRSRMDRKVTHLKDRESVRAEDDLKRQRKAAKATLDATLSGLSPENQQRLLAQIINQCESAQMENAA